MFHFDSSILNAGTQIYFWFQKHAFSNMCKWEMSHNQTLIEIYENWEFQAASHPGQNES